MKKNFRKITSLVVAFAVMVTAVVFDVPGTVVAEAATENCDGSHSGMTEWTDTTSLPDKSGSYYLNCDVTLTNRAYYNVGDVTLCLNGHKVDAQNKSCIYIVSGSGFLTLCDCQDSGILTGGNSGAIKVDQGGTFIMNGGTISGNTATSSGGGAVQMTASTKFIMNGGTISGNTATGNGGGVRIGGTNASFTMNGGTISGNTATGDGGGVYIAYSSGSFTMNGGTISGNTANSGGGVSLADGKITISGNVNISGNKKGAVADNVYLPTGKTITVNSLNAASKIGVNTATTPANCKNYVNVTGTTINISDCFTADIDGQIVVYDNRTVRLTVAHSAEKTEAKAATCTEDGNKDYWHCTVCDKYFSDSECADEIEENETVIEATDHQYGAWSITKKPTTTTEGTAERVCEKNDDTQTVTLPVLTDSTWEKTETTKPTVDTDGSYTYTSDYGTVTIPVPKLNDDTVWTKTETTKPTVDTDGSYTYTSDYGTVTVPVPKLTDDTVWTKTETTKPTVDTDGSYTYTSDYGTVTIPVPKLNDDTVWTKTETTKPTVDTDGSYTYTSDYGTVTATVPKLSDTSVWTNTQHVDATEEQAGKDVYTSAYGEVTVTIPTLTHTHTLTHVPEVSATETTEGTKEHWHCEGCGKDFLDAEGTTEATAENLTIPKPNHTHSMTHVPEVSATETTEGVKEHWHCDGCNKDFADENGTSELTDLTIPPLGHTHTLTHVPEVSATETTEGTKEHWHCAGCNKDFADENGEKEITADELKIGKIEKEVQSGENAPTAELTTPKEELIDAVLTSEEQAVVNDGKDVKIILTIEDATESVSSEDKTAVESKIESLTDYHLGQYLDVNLLKIIDGETKKIAETSAPITITFEIPAELRVSGRSYSVIRVHDGETTVLPDLDNDENTITIQTDKFSTYALAYLENAAASDPSGGSTSTPTTPTPGGNNSGGNSGTRPSGSNPSSGNGNSWIGGNGTSNGNSTANESDSPGNGDDSSNDRNEDDSSDIEDDSSDVEDDPSDGEDDSSDVEDDFSDDDDDFSDVDDDSSDDDDDSTGVEEDSPAGEGNSESGNSDQAVNASSEDTAFSVDGTGYASDESDSNPSTGVAVSFVPLAAAMTVLMAAKRKKK